jgi:hypothetical protein
LASTRVVTHSGTASPTVDDASRHIAARYELDFASLWWLVEPREGAATLSRIDCRAWDRSLGADVAVVASALLACLRERVAAMGERVAAP